jgi:hypothetical protein
MFALGRKPVVPVVPGPDGPREPPFACGACGKGGLYEQLDDDLLCVDFKACIKRWRGDMSPDTYAAGLRGELLAVAP